MFCCLLYKNLHKSSGTRALDAAEERTVLHLANTNTTRDENSQDYCTESCPILDSCTDAIGEQQLK